MDQSNCFSPVNEEEKEREEEEEEKEREEEEEEKLEEQEDDITATMQSSTVMEQSYTRGPRQLFSGEWGRGKGGGEQATGGGGV